MAVRSPAIPCKICRDGSGRHPVYSSMEDRAYGHPEGYLCNDCANHAPTSMVEITPDGQEVPGMGPGKPGPHLHVDWSPPFPAIDLEMIRCRMRDGMTMSLTITNTNPETLRLFFGEDISEEGE